MGRTPRPRDAFLADAAVVVAVACGVSEWVMEVMTVLLPRMYQKQIRLSAWN